MTHRTFAALALVPLTLAPMAYERLSHAEPLGAESTLAALGDDLKTLIAEEAAQASERRIAEVWQRSRALREAGRLGADGELDRTLDRFLADEALSPKATILVCSARLQGEDPDATPLSSALEPLIQAADDDVARAAASLLADKNFKSLNRSRRGELVDTMLAAASDTTRSPEYRLDFAMSAYRLGSGKARRDVRDIMLSFLDSSDAELSAQGAIALATATESDLDGKLRDVLEELAMVPNDRGRLAAAYLELESEREYAARKLRDVRNEASKDKLPEEFEELLAVRNLITSTHLEGSKVDEHDLIGAAIDGMLRWMDPHSNYFSSDAYAKFSQDLDAEYGGIGAYVNEHPDDGLFTIVRPIYSGPAYKAGLLTDDKIVRIGNWPTTGKPEADIIKRLKGKPGTPVELYIWRHGMDPGLIERPSEEMKVVVTRDRIEIPAGSRQMLPGGIGLVELNEFSKKAQEQIESWLPEMLGDGMRALVLDMRRNSGGLLTEARDVADLFLPAGEVVVKTDNRQGEPEIHYTERPAILPNDIPILILTSRNTASAAEIVAGALQDHGRATLIGKRTFGKGSVQQLIPILHERQDYWKDTNQNYRWDEGEEILRDFDGDGEVDYCPRVKLTIARYLLPSGRSIHHEIDREGAILSAGGVKPDIEVDLPLIERWRFDERNKMRESDVLRDYVSEFYPQNVELFQRLAVNDQKDPTLYPDFDTLMVALETTLDRDDVRGVLRAAIRRRVQDDLGREFPFGDYEEDEQVQKAIAVALEQLGEDVDDVADYRPLFDFDKSTNGRDLALIDPEGTPSLNRVRQLLEDARRGTVMLNNESLDELIGLIDGIKEPKKN